MWNVITDYCAFYQTYLQMRWNSLQPNEYAVILISVAVIGFLTMGNQKRR